MAAKKKEPLCLSEFSTSAIEAEAEHRGILNPSLDEYPDNELLDELADRGILPEDPTPEPMTPKDFPTQELIQELMRRPEEVNSRQTGLSVRLDIQINGRSCCNSYGPNTVLWKRD